MEEEYMPDENEDEFETDSNISETDLDYEQDGDDNPADLEMDTDDLLSKDKKDGLNLNEDDVESYRDPEEETENVEDNEEDDDYMANDDDDDDDELNSTKKVHLFNKEENVDFIKMAHPECLPINMDELKVMLPVIRNEHGIIIDDFHTTLPVLTKYEKTRVLGQRASMIEHGAKPFVYVPANIIDSPIIAEMELNAKKIPFIIKRPLPNNGFEYWRLSDLELM